MPVLAARRRPGAAVTAVAGVALGVGLALASGAWAHDGPESSRPAAGSEVAVAPTSVELVFSGDVVSASVEVVDGCGRTVPSTATRDGDEVRAELRAQEQADGRGGWVVRWGTVGGDGHPVQGELTFSVAGTPSCATPEVDEPAPGTPAAAGGGLEVPAPVITTAAVVSGSAGAADPQAGAGATTAVPSSSAPTGALLAGGVVVVAGAWVVGDRLRRDRSRRSPGTGS